MKRRTIGEELEQQQQQQQQPIDSVINTNSADSKISEALFKLSVTDRNAIQEEIHGVCCLAPDETPELLQDSLDKFHLELAKINSKPGYDRAQELLESNPPGYPSSYIHAKAFKLRFLRCELFDACKAAKRYSKYLDVILDLHGETALERPIRLSDLSREEISFLRKGHSQVLPCRDRSGRRIVCVVPNSTDNVPKKIVLKVYIYIWCSVIGGCDIVNNDCEQFETQRKGALAIIFPSLQHFFSITKTEASQKWAKTRVEVNKIVGSIVPVRTTAVHICLPNNPLATSLSAMFQMMLSNWLPRTKFHFGNPLEIRYQLQGYGIPTEFIPTTDTGNIKSANLKHWIKMRTYLEWQAQQPKPTLHSSESDGGSDLDSISSSLGIQPPNQIVECPGSNDVIFRRGKAMNHHAGNAKFLNLIESRIYEHTIDPKTPPMRRMAIEMELIQEIRESGGRFLRWEIDKCWWEDMSIGTGTPLASNREADREIQSKVHYAFRDFRKKMLRNEQTPIVNTSSTYAFERQDLQKRKRYSNGADAGCNEYDCTIGDRCISGSSDHSQNPKFL